MGKVLWHSLTEDGKVEIVKIKFGNKIYDNVNVKHLNPIDEGSHSHPKRKKNADKKKKQESKMGLKLEELVGKSLTEEQFDEAAGKKDACYHKVKARYDVWPSAYASGALVKCRKVGAANWGNKSKKKEGVNEGKFRVHFDLNPDASPAQRLGLMSVEVTAKDKKEAEKMVASKFVGGMKLIRKNMTKKLKEGLNEAKYTHKYPSITAMAKDYKRIFPETGPARVKIAAGSKREATGKRSQPAFITIEGDKKLVDAYKKIAFDGTGKYTDVMKSVNEGLDEKRGTCWVGYKQLGMKKKGGKMVPNCVKEITEIYYEENGKGHGYTFEYINDGKLNEAEYQGRKVKLGKVMQGDTKKFKVYVKNPKGNVVKVNFGQGGDAKGGTMRIRKDNPKARKSFRARHNCDNPGPRHKARYWSCKKW